MWRELWEHHRGKTIGAVTGIFLGFIYLFFGFWNMLIFSFIIYVGYYFGRKIDRKEELFHLESFAPLWSWMTKRWNMFK